MPPTATTVRREPGSLSGNGARLVPPARQRSIPLAVLGVLLCFVGALVFGALHLRLDHRTAVLAVARPVAAGQVIHDSDLRVVRVSADGIDTISEADRSAVVGHVAAVPLVPGGLLIRSEMGSAASLTAGQAVVGLALKDGQLPLGLRPGDRVLVVDTGARTPAAGGSVPARSFGDRVVGTVVSVQPASSSSGVTVVSLQLAEADASGVAAAATAGQVSLVQVAAGS
jgi:SAF domain